MSTYARQAGQAGEEMVGEAVDRIGGVVLETAQIDDQMDGLLIGPDVGSSVDTRLEDGQIR